MFPGIYGFHWDAGHVIFLGAFYAAVTLIAITIARSILRSRRAIRDGEAPAVRWSADFHDLPERARRCRHELNGEIDRRQCPHEFDCRECEKHPTFGPALPAGAPSFEVLGLSIPLDRRYHRGHTWVRGERNGTFTVGLDPLAARIVGTDALAELPPVGTQLRLNTPGWTMRCGADPVRVLSPIDGTVIDTADGRDGWFLKILPGDDARTTHLLSASEVIAWMNAEVERLQLALGAALADGGALVEDPGKAYPEREWQSARAEFLLEP